MMRVAGRLTILTPSLTAVLTPTQTFFPSSHFDTADENLYDSSSPVTTSQSAPHIQHKCGSNELAHGEDAHDRCTGFACRLTGYPVVVTGIDDTVGIESQNR
jgi:hypothetical protein